MKDRDAEARQTANLLVIERHDLAHLASVTA
jgi:hypothetical protein